MRKLIEAGGGHAMAAGVTLHREQLPAFEAYLGESLGTMALDAPRRLRLDASLTPQAATRDLWETMQQVGPFGAGNPEPRLVLPAVKIVNHGIVGDGHVRCVLAGRGRAIQKPWLLHPCRKRCACCFKRLASRFISPDICAPMTGMGGAMCSLWFMMPHPHKRLCKA